MAKRRRKKSGGGDDIPAWLITFSDMMTLLLTFFVLLNSMAVIDEKRKLVALGSIVGTFGEGVSRDVLARTDTRKSVEPGPMEDVGDLEPLKPLIWEDLQEDLRFAENRFVQVLSVSADVLFDKGSATLSAKGRSILDRILPVLARVDHPILLAGHTSTLRDEMGRKFQLEMLEAADDPSWMISLRRVSAVYRYLLDSGLNPEMLRMEAFGRYRPRYDEKTPEGRKMNRRVDIVLDKRSSARRTDLERLLPHEGKREDSFTFDGFRFNVARPGEGGE